MGSLYPGAGRRAGPPPWKLSRSPRGEQGVDLVDRLRIGTHDGRLRAALRVHLDVTLHLLVQRAAEVRAVERVDPGLLRGPADGLGLAGLDLHVLARPQDAEAVRDVVVLLQVGPV